jgi:hypothetical protein
MAAFQFKNAPTPNIGTSGADVYSTPSGQKSIVIGLSVTNRTGAALPVEVYISRSGQPDVFLSRDTRIAGGESYDFLSGKKLVTESDESVRVVSKVDNSLDCIVSVLEDVD